MYVMEKSKMKSRVIVVGNFIDCQDAFQKFEIDLIDS